MIFFVCNVLDCILRILVIQLTLCFPLPTIFVDLSLGQVFVYPSIDLPLLNHSLDFSKFKISTITSTFTWMIRLLIIYLSITADILFVQPTYLTSSTSELSGKSKYSTSLSIVPLDISTTTLHSTSLSIEPLDVSPITIASTSLHIEHSDHIASSQNPIITLPSTESSVDPCHSSRLSIIESSLIFQNSTVDENYLKISKYYTQWVFPFSNLQHYYKEFTTRRQLNLDVPAGFHQENDLRRQFRDVVTTTKFVPTLPEYNIFQDLSMYCQSAWFIVEFSKK